MATLDGLEHHRLRRASEGRLSPDGRLLAYVAGRHESLGIARVASGRRIRLLARNVRSVDWSPDGREVVYATYNDGEVGVDDMFLAAIDGGRPQQLTFTPDVEEHDAVWAPSGRRIAFSRGRGLRGERHQSSVWTVDPDGGRLEEVFRLPPQFDEGPDWGTPYLSWQPLSRP